MDTARMAFPLRFPGSRPVTHRAGRGAQTSLASAQHQLPWSHFFTAETSACKSPCLSLWSPQGKGDGKGRFGRSPVLKPSWQTTGHDFCVSVILLLIKITLLLIIIPHLILPEKWISFLFCLAFQHI